MNISSNRRRFFVPETIQTSSMDCGPAALKSLLDGFHIAVSYGRLREACQTDVDGTSIDTLEEMAQNAGLEAEQVLVPADHVLEAAAKCLPCIAAVRGITGYTHFIVVWRAHGSFVQIMDPARGRLWLHRSTLLNQLISHSMPVTASDWGHWARTDDFIAPLQRRLVRLGVARARANAAIARAAGQDGWQPLATLDAAARMVASFQQAGTLPGRASWAAVSQMVDLAGAADNPTRVIPEPYWSARGTFEETAARIIIRGAVLARVKGRHMTLRRQAGAAETPDLTAAFAEPPGSPLPAVWRIVRMDGFRTPALLVAALAVSACSVVFEALLFRSAVDVRQMVQGPGQMIWAGVALISFVVLVLGLEGLCAAVERRMGSHLEARLRMAFLDKLPRLSAAHFLSRPIADMLERSHALHLLRVLPRLGSRFLRVIFELIVTAGAMIWLSPEATPLVVIATVCAVLIPLAGHALIAERDLRARTHTGALATFHLDALRGRTAIEAHGAAAAIEKEHELKLADWAAAALSLQHASTGIEGLQMTVGFGLAAWMLFGHVSAAGAAPVLLQAYWMLNLPSLGYELAMIARDYPSLRTTLLRVLEPLGAPETGDAEAAPPVASTRAPGVTVSFRGAAVRITGHVVLDDITLDIAAGEHVAIVGSSGAGKSTLAGLLLGWCRTAGGIVLVDGAPLDEPRLSALRQSTAWVDPTVQIWNRTLLDNLLYGADGNIEALGAVLEGAGLLPLVARLPEGLATSLGEGGALLSGGEAQRVRLGRALLKRAPTLVVLDEPLVGLERDRRRALLAFARQRWARSTLLYITHDIPEVRAFDRVIVMDRGRIAEDGDPRLLANMPSSRYRRMLHAHEAAQSRFHGTDWRRIRMSAGRITHDHVKSSEQTA